MGLLGWHKNTPAAKDVHTSSELILDDVDTSLPIRDKLYFDFEVMPIVFIEFNGDNKTVVAVLQGDGTINPLEFSLTSKQQHELLNSWMKWKLLQE